MTRNRGVVESFGLPMVKPFLCFGSPPFAFNKIVYHEYLASQCRKLGKTWARYDGVAPCIVSIDPDFIKEVLVKQFDNFTDVFDAHTKPEQTTLDISRGEEWRALRKMLSPVFTTGKMKGMLEPMEQLADRTIDHIGEMVKKNPVLDLKPVIQGFTLDTISRCAFGIDTNVYKGENSDFADNAAAVFNAFAADNWIGVLFFNLMAHFPGSLKYISIWPKEAEKIRVMTHDIMEERDKTNAYFGDFIDKLRDERSKLEAPVTRGMLDAQGIVFLTAGFETTANTIGHLLYNLARNPEVQETVVNEINQVLEDHSTINHETIKDMHYLEATIEESLRLCPPITEHDRQCTRDTVVNGIKIPAGTRMQFPTYAAHFDEDFFPEPTQFRPERFLKENADQIIPYTWRPFGGGNRVCIGQRFAIIEIKIFMAKMLSKFKVVATPETVIKYKPGDLFLLYYPNLIVKLENRE